MNRREFLRQVRVHIGETRESTVSDSQLTPCIRAALQWVSGEVGSDVREDLYSLSVQAGIGSYTLPAAVAQILSVSRASGPLTPKTLATWLGEQVNWRNATAGTPGEYIVQGRRLIFDRPPDAASVESDPTYTVRYEYAAVALTPAELAQLPEEDARLAALEAAIRWCADNPNPDTVVRVQGLQAIQQRDLKRIKARGAAAVHNTQTSFRVETGRRPVAR